jgi:hypothetical protein
LVEEKVTWFNFAYPDLILRELLTWSGGPCLLFMISAMTVGSVHLLYNSSWKSHQLAAEQLLAGQRVLSVMSVDANISSQCKSHLPDHSPPAKLGRAPCRASPLYDNASSLLTPYFFRSEGGHREQECKDWYASIFLLHLI